MASLLPLPDDPRFQRAQELWQQGWFQQYPHPRSIWLGVYEDLLRQFYPASSSRDRKLTARHYAPFPLASGHDVP